MTYNKPKVRSVERPTEAIHGGRKAWYYYLDLATMLPDLSVSAYESDE